MGKEACTSGGINPESAIWILKRQKTFHLGVLSHLMLRKQKGDVKERHMIHVHVL